MKVSETLLRKIIRNRLIVSDNSRKRLNENFDSMPSDRDEWTNPSEQLTGETTFEKENGRTARMELVKWFDDPEDDSYTFWLFDEGPYSYAFRAARRPEREDTQVAIVASPRGRSSLSNPTVVNPEREDHFGPLWGLFSGWLDAKRIPMVDTQDQDAADEASQNERNELKTKYETAMSAAKTWLTGWTAGNNVSATWSRANNYSRITIRASEYDGPLIFHVRPYYRAATDDWVAVMVGGKAGGSNENGADILRRAATMVAEEGQGYVDQADINAAEDVAYVIGYLATKKLSYLWNGDELWRGLEYWKKKFYDSQGEPMDPELDNEAIEAMENEVGIGNLTSGGSDSRWGTVLPSDVEGYGGDTDRPNDKTQPGYYLCKQGT
jgi:hypothetical protein